MESNEQNMLEILRKNRQEEQEKSDQFQMDLDEDDLRFEKQDVDWGKFTKSQEQQQLDQGVVQFSTQESCQKIVVDLDNQYQDVKKGKQVQVFEESVQLKQDQQKDFKQSEEQFQKDDSQINMAIYLNNKRQLEKKKQQQPRKQDEIKKLGKKDFTFQKGQKVKNILDNEEEVGEVGEWIEETANKKKNFSVEKGVENGGEESDEFEKAFEEGFKKVEVEREKKDANVLDEEEKLIDYEQIKQQKLQAQKRAEQKLQNLERGTAGGGSRSGYMVNRLQQKVKNLEEKKVAQKEEEKEINQEVQVVRISPEFIEISDDEDENKENQEKQEKSEKLEKQDNKENESLPPIQIVKRQSSSKESRNSFSSNKSQKNAFVQSGGNNIPIIDDEIEDEENKNNFQDQKQQEKIENLPNQITEKLEQVPEGENQKQQNDILPEDEWDFVSKETLLFQQLQANKVQQTLKPIEFQDAWQKVKGLDLTEQLKKVQSREKKEQGLLENLKSLMCSKRNLANPALLNERDFILAFGKLKFDDHEQLHFQMLYTVFFKLKDQERCLRYGGHWESIGFQGSDPASDIRGGGMFGVLQLLAFACNMKDLMKDILDYSHHEVYHFPLAITFLNISDFVLSYLREDRLNSMINSERQVMSVLNKVFFASVWMFFLRYKHKQANFQDIGFILNFVKEEVYKSPKKAVDEFGKQLEKYYKNK